MEPERRNQISDLYQSVLARAPGDRSAFLKEACGGDQALRQEVESLLDYESASVRFLETPAAEALLIEWLDADDGDLTGSLFGRQECRQICVHLCDVRN